MAVLRAVGKKVVHDPYFSFQLLGEEQLVFLIGKNKVFGAGIVGFCERPG